MRLPFYRRMLGYYRVWVTERAATQLKNLIFTEHITAYADGDNAFFIPWKEKKRLLAAAGRARLPLSVGSLLGFPAFLYRHRLRVGVPIGVLLAAGILFFGTNTVWRVEVSGNETLSATEIEDGLRSLGYGVGSPTRRESYDELIASFRLSHPEIAWMGIYTRGTTAYVRVIETERGEAAPPSVGQPSHLIAEQDAVILRMEIDHGTSAVREGEVVKQGDVLVLGWLKGAHNDRLIAAEGKVIGRVRETFSVTVPYKEAEKVEVDRQKTKISLIFFEKRINIFKKNYKNGSDYVIINKNRYLSLPNGRKLPFGFAVTEAVSYREEECVIDKDTARLLGKDELEAQLRLTLDGDEPLYRRVWIEETNDACVLHATVEYTKNIAVRQPFGLE